MSILITGGAGYIGSHLIQYLLEKNVDVVAVDDLSTGNRDFVLCDKFYNINIRDMDGLDKIFKENKIDAVIHLAAYSLVGDSVANPFKYYENNVYSTACLLETMKKNKVDKIVFSSTASVYGDVDRLPITEDMPTIPTNTYARTKLDIENMMKNFETAYGIKSVALRYFNAAGSDVNAKIGEIRKVETHIIPIILRNLIDRKDYIDVFGNDYPTYDGTCIRDYIHVLDLAHAHYLAVNHLLNGGKSDFYNLGSGKGYSVLEVIDAARKVTGRKIDINFVQRRAGDPPCLVASYEKFKKDLGFALKYPSIESMIEHAWNFYKIYYSI